MRGLELTASERRMLLWAVLAGVVFHVVAIATIRHGMGGDSPMYHQFAVNMLTHHTYALGEGSSVTPSVLRAPLFSMLLAATYALFGEGMLALQILQSLLGIVKAILIYFIVRRWSPNAAKAALWLAMFDPFGAAFDGAVLSESLCAFLLVASLALLTFARGWPGWFAAGCAFGLLVLTRDVYLALVPPMAALAFAGPGLPATGRRLPAAGRAALSAAFVVGSVLAIAPWSFRNYLVTGHFIPVSKGLLGFNLWVGTWERNDEWTLETPNVFPEYAFDSPEEKRELEPLLEQKRLGASDDSAVFSGHNSTAMRDNQFIQIALHRIIGHPFRTAKVWLLRSYRMWIGTRAEIFDFGPAWLARGRPLWYVLKSTLFGLNLMILLLGVLGGVSAYVKRSPLLALAVPLVWTVLVYLPLHSVEPRFSAPVYPCLLALAAEGIVLVAALLSARAKGASAGLLASEQ